MAAAGFKFSIKRFIAAQARGTGMTGHQEMGFEAG